MREVMRPDTEESLLVLSVDRALTALSNVLRHFNYFFFFFIP